MMPYDTYYETSLQLDNVVLRERLETASEAWREDGIPLSARGVGSACREASHPMTECRKIPSQIYSAYSCAASQKHEVTLLV